MKLNTFAAASALAWGAIASSPVLAAINTPARESLSTITFSDLSFSDASLLLSSTQTVAAGSSGSEQYLLFVFPAIQSLSLSSTGDVGVAIDLYTLPTDLDVTVSATGPAGGSWNFSGRYPSFDNDPDAPSPLGRYLGDATALIAFDDPNRIALELFMPMQGLADTGGTFSVGFTVPGDFSTPGRGSASGQHYLAGLDPAWVIDTNFVYDPVAGLTRFHATNAAYDFATAPSPYLDVYLFGSAVPEPSTWALMIAGFAAVGFVARRRPGARSAV